MERYKFQKFPQKLNRRVRRIEGRGVPSRKISGTLSYKHLSFGTAFLVVETRSNTMDSKQILEDALLWGAGKFGLNYEFA